MSKVASARPLPAIPPLVKPRPRLARRPSIPMAEFWITDVRYGSDGRIERYGLIPAPVWARYLTGRAAAATVFVLPEHVESMIEAGVGIYTTRKSKDGRTVARGPVLEPGKN